MRDKKGDVWVSAVLYMALGLVVVTLVLAAGIPLIIKMKDRNTVTQTKNTLLVIDDDIRVVAIEGPGSRRIVSPFEIGSGQLTVNTEEDYVEWRMTTKNKMMEPNITFDEGTLNLRLDETIIEEQYDIIIAMNYTGAADLIIEDNNPTGPFKGRYNLVITHTGNFNELGVPKVSLAFL